MILPSSQKRKRRHPGCVAELSKEKTTAPMGCGPQGEGCGGGGARWAEGSAERVVVLKYSCHELEARWGKITSWPIHKFKFAFDLGWWLVGWVGGWVGGGGWGGRERQASGAWAPEHCPGRDRHARDRAGARRSRHCAWPPLRWLPSSGWSSPAPAKRMIRRSGPPTSPAASAAPCGGCARGRRCQVSASPRPRRPSPAPAAPAPQSPGRRHRKPNRAGAHLGVDGLRPSAGRCVGERRRR